MESFADPVDLTKKLIAFDTVNPPGFEKDGMEYLAEILKNAGFNIALYSFAEGRPSLVAVLEAGSESKPICFTGHLDTVPIGGVEWQIDPFAGEVDGDKLYGRGSSDMKSGVAAMVAAALKIAKSTDLAAGLSLVITAGEETGSQGAKYLAELGNVLGEAGALVVGEPTSNYPFIGHKGALWVEARTTGVTAHGAMPEQGINAIYKMIPAVERIKDLRFAVPPHVYLGSPTLNVGTISGGLNINSVPDVATIGIDIRTIPGLSNRIALEKLKSQLGEEVEIEILVNMDAIGSDPEHPWIREIMEMAKPYVTERIVPRGAAYFTDASILSPAFGNPPTVLLGPGEPDMAHKTDEYCYISKIEDAAKIYFEIGKRWCGA